MMDRSRVTFGYSFTPRLVLGVGLMLFGVVLLLGRLEVVDTASVLRFWPVVLIAIGVQQYLRPRVGANGERTYPVHGIIWMAIGGVLLLDTLDILRVSIWELVWPAVLIAIGVRLMTRSGRRDSRAGTAEGAGAGGDMGSIFAVLSGVKRVSAPQPFHGADVTTFMGGAHLDLRQAIILPGSEAVLDVFAVIGGCELLIPPDWVVSAPIMAVMGGVDDKRLVQPPTVIEQATASGYAPPRLVVRGFVMMGGVTIRS